MEQIQEVKILFALLDIGALDIELAESLRGTGLNCFGVDKV